MGELRDYLDRLKAELRLPPDLRNQIHAEIADHLSDSIASLRAEGLDHEHAVREALARLGRPEALAEDLRRAHQTRRRALAGAAGGVWGAATGAIAGSAYGLLLAWIGLMLGGIGLTLVQMTTHQSMPTDVLSRDPIAELVACVGAVVSGRAAVLAAARSSLRAATEVRLPVAILGTLVLLPVVLFAIPMSQSWGTVLSLLAIPPCFAAGALLSSRPLRRHQIRTDLIVIAVGIAASAISVVAAADRAPTGGHVEIVGPYIDATATAFARHDLVVRDGVATAEAGPVPEGAWRDLRFAAWLGPDVRMDPGTAPFASAPARMVGDEAVGELRLGVLRGSTDAWIALTGVGDDGRRYVLGAPSPAHTPFYGTAWDWLSAPG